MLPQDHHLLHNQQLSSYFFARSSTSINSYFFAHSSTSITSYFFAHSSNSITSYFFTPSSTCTFSPCFTLLMHNQLHLLIIYPLLMFLQLLHLITPIDHHHNIHVHNDMILITHITHIHYNHHHHIRNIHNHMIWIVILI